MRRALLLMLLAGCGPAIEIDAGSFDSGASTDAGTTDAGMIDAGMIDAGMIDAGMIDAGMMDAGLPDAGAPDAGRSFRLPTCLGPSLALQRAGQLPYVDATLGTGASAQTRAFLIDFGSTSSWVDLNAFTGAPQQFCSSGTCTYADFDYFGSWGQVTFNTADFSAFPGPPRQAGIVGTDFLSVNPTTLDYRGQRVFTASPGTFCNPAQLGDAGFVELSTTGFYSTQFSNLRALSSVIDGGAAGLTVPNVPTIRVRVDGVEAFAQLDTGFDDAVVHNSININTVYLNAILSQAPGTLVRANGLDLTLSTCVGIPEPVTAWRIAAGHQLEFVASDGSVAHAWPNAVLFAKNTPAAARVCGGVGTWTVSAAQVAASFFVDAEAVVFDPVRSMVWMPR